MSTLTKDQKLSALRDAVLTGNLPVVKALIAGGDIDLNAQVAGSRDAYKGVRLLHLAGLAGNFEVVSALVSGGADIEARDDRGLMPAAYALIHMQQSLNNLGYSGAAPQQLQRLPSNAPKLDFVGAIQRDVGLTRIGNEMFDIAKRPEPSSLSPKDKKEALRAAILENDLPLVRELVKDRDFDLNDAVPGLHSSLSGATPLHLAALVGNTDIISTLVAAGAKLDVLDSRGKTPAEYAVVHTNQALNNLGYGGILPASLTPIAPGVQSSDVVNNVRRGLGVSSPASSVFDVPMPQAKPKKESDDADRRLPFGIFAIPSLDTAVPPAIAKRNDPMRNPFALEMRPQP